MTTEQKKNTTPINSDDYGETMNTHTHTHTHAKNWEKKYIKKLRRVVVGVGGCGLWWACSSTLVSAAARDFLEAPTLAK